VSLQQAPPTGTRLDRPSPPETTRDGTSPPETTRDGTSPPETTRDGTSPPETTRDGALARIAARAGELDRQPRFPVESFDELRAAGVLTAASSGLASDVRLVRAVAAADASTARILDGHLNGVERLTLTADEPLLSAELARVRAGELLLGVWGADPAAGEGEPAQLVRDGDRLVLRGVKTFCSGAGGVQRALVVVRGEDDSKRLAYLDTSSRLNVDRGWYRASGLRSSESHRVEFHDAPVLALLGGPGELGQEPYFSRDAIRTSATWAGLADAIVAATIAALDPGRLDAMQAHAVGQMRVAQSTIDRWLDHTAASLDQSGCGLAGEAAAAETTAANPPAREAATAKRPAAGHSTTLDPTLLAVECRVALYECARLISAHAARVCGSRALIGASALDRVRRDLDLFLLQHRLDPKIAKLGTEMLSTEQP
jgi:alkylation response protein AidB-like acyl-CoA dehydrogenase